MLLTWNYSAPFLPSQTVNSLYYKASYIFPICGTVAAGLAQVTFEGQTGDNSQIYWGEIAPTLEEAISAASNVSFSHQTRGGGAF